MFHSSNHTLLRRRFSLLWPRHHDSTVGVALDKARADNKAPNLYTFELGAYHCRAIMEVANIITC